MWVAPKLRPWPELGRSDRANQRLAWHCNISTLNFDFELGGRGSVQVGRFPRAALLIYNSGVGIEGFQAGGRGPRRRRCGGDGLSRRRWWG